MDEKLLMNELFINLKNIDKELLAKNWTWLGVGGKPKFHFFPENIDELKFFLKNKPKDLKYRTFGAGSNILIRDNGYDGVFIRLKKNFRNIQLENNEIIIDAGLTSLIAAQKCLNLELGGLEFISTIPGQIGGMIKMNAGAYGSEIKNFLNWVEIMDEFGNIHRLKNHECGFQYRKSEIKNNWIILKASFNYEKKTQKEIFEKMKNFKEQREKSQPTKGKMAGCFFKNHEKISAWLAIKNSKIENFQTAQVSKIHSNFLMASSETTSFEIEYLIEKLRANILFNQGVLLESEVERIGNF